MKLERTFYTRDDVCEVAQDLLGKILCVSENGITSRGIIVETEAYSHIERACHAYNGRRTKRTETIFQEGGTSYVYLIYGIHKLFNVVTNVEGVAEAVLVRAVEPIEPIEIMERKRGGGKEKFSLTSGPGKLSIAMGIGMDHNNADLLGDQLWIEDKPLEPFSIVSTTRIGVDYAGEDAYLPWRYYIDGNPWVSRK